VIKIARDFRDDRLVLVGFLRAVLHEIDVTTLQTEASAAA